MSWRPVALCGWSSPATLGGDVGVPRAFAVPWPGGARLLAGLRAPPGEPIVTPLQSKQDSNCLRRRRCPTPRPTRCQPPTSTPCCGRRGARRPGPGDPRLPRPTKAKAGSFPRPSASPTTVSATTTARSTTTPVASRLGPRFYDWQLAQDADEALCECHLHARNLLGHVKYARLRDRLIEDGGADGDHYYECLDDPARDLMYEDPGSQSPLADGITSGDGMALRAAETKPGYPAKSSAKQPQREMFRGPQTDLFE